VPFPIRPIPSLFCGLVQSGAYVWAIPKREIERRWLFRAQRNNEACVRKSKQIAGKVENGGFAPIRPAQFLRSEKSFKIIQGNQ